jgi:drug/metabolite transporter (DMT)-like permease
LKAQRKQGRSSLRAFASWAKVSFVVPATAAHYIVGGLGAKFLLKERLSQVRWAGMLLVAVGVALVCAAR